MPLYSFITALFFLIVSLPSAAVESSRPFSVSWTVINGGTEQRLWGVHFAGPEAGWAVGEFGTILATRDGGATWTPQASGTDRVLLDVHFATPGAGWAVGSDGAILATRDGGATWTRQASGTSDDLYGVHFAGPEAGSIVGAARTILAASMPNYAPRIVTIDFKRQLDGAVKMTIELANEEGEDANIVEIWFRTHKEQGFWRPTEASPQKEDGRWVVTWNPGGAKFGLSSGSSLYFRFKHGFQNALSGASAK